MDLWREYRLNRLILIAGGACFLLPYAISGVNEVLYQDGYLTGAWTVSVLSIYLFVSLLAGNALAGERCDRSAEFVAYLPIARWRIVIGKLLFALMAFSPMWCVTHVVVNHVIRPTDFAAHVMLDLRPFVVNIVAIYGVGWLFTSFLSSVAFASIAGFTTPLLFYGCHAAILAQNGDLGDERLRLIRDPVGYGEAVSGYMMTGIPFGIVCFGVGTWNYLRRSTAQGGVENHIAGDMHLDSGLNFNC